VKLRKPTLHRRTVVLPGASNGSFVKRPIRLFVLQQIGDLFDTLFSVGLSDLHQASRVMGVEHHQTQPVGTDDFVGSQASHQVIGNRRQVVAQFAGITDPIPSGQLEMMLERNVCDEKTWASTFDIELVDYT
jgi:hypothetical protein